MVAYMGEDVPVDMVTVPNITGLGVWHVKDRLSKLGLFYRSQGTEYTTGAVISGRQDILPGTQVPVGTILTVEFKDLNQTSQ
jgi:hypothetical protein